MLHLCFCNTSFRKLLPTQINLCTPSFCGDHSTHICSCSYLKSQHIKPKHSEWLIPWGRLENPNFSEFLIKLFFFFFFFVLCYGQIDMNNYWSGLTRAGLFLWFFFQSFIVGRAKVLRSCRRLIKCHRGHRNHMVKNMSCFGLTEHSCTWYSGDLKYPGESAQPASVIIQLKDKDLLFRLFHPVYTSLETASLESFFLLLMFAYIPFHVLPLFFSVDLL